MRLLAVPALALVLLAPNASADPGTVRVSGPSPFPAACSEPGPGTLHLNAEVQPHLAVNPKNPRHLVGTFQQDRWSSIASQGVLTATSFDGGRTWRRAVPPTSECSGHGDLKRATDSWVSVSPNGTAYLATLAMSKVFFEPESEHAIQVSRSRDGGLTWEAPTVLASGGGTTVFNDLPAVTADPLNPRFVYAVWTKIALLSETDFTGDTFFSRSTDGGRTWEPARPIFEPGVNQNTVANQIVIRPDGTLVNVFTHANANVPQLDIAAMTSTDRGRTWSAPTRVAALTAAGTSDPDAGTPIRNGAEFAHAAADARGNLYVAWQDSRFAGGARDGIALSRSTDGGRTWSTPVAVNGAPETQAFSPAVAVRNDGTVGVTYYDLRDNTSDPATLPTNFWLATSPDGGTTWSERRVTSFDYATAPTVDRPPGALYLGDYHGLVAAGSTFVPLFPVANTNSADRSDILSARLR